jgi:hypothetical protein
VNFFSGGGREPTPCGHVCLAVCFEGGGPVKEMTRFLHFGLSA